MAVFAILTEVSQPELRKAVETAYPDEHFHWSDTVSFVRANGTAQKVSAEIGVKQADPEADPTSGFTSVAVMQLAPSYFGWSKASGWEWLKDSFEAS